VVVGQDPGPSLGTLCDELSAAVGRTSIYIGVVFAVVGFIAGVYALSLGPITNLPTVLLLLLCPAAILGAISPGAETDVVFLWMIAFLNSFLYGVLGAFLGKLFHVDDQ
jgi:hypothetical protein